MIRFSESLWTDLQQIRRFLFTRMYRAPSVMAKRAEVTVVVEKLFALFMEQPELMPAHWQADPAASDRSETVRARHVSDYIAGMTDRFALQEHARLFGAMLPGLSRAGT